MIIILLSRNYQMSLNDNLNVLGKQSTRKVQGFFPFNKKENYKNRLSFLMKVLKIYATK